MGFVQSYSDELDDFEDFNQIIPGSYKSDKPVKFTGIDELPHKCNCIDGSVVKGIREPTLYSFVLDKSPGSKINEEPRIKLLKR